MLLRTKSIQAKTELSDGLRICVMRRPGEFDNWDMWIPKLAPSTELLNAYKYEDLPWEQLVERYTKEVLNTQEELLGKLVALLESGTVTLLCWEETADFCHRKLLADACKLLVPDLQIEHEVHSSC